MPTTFEEAIAGVHAAGLRMTRPREILLRLAIEATGPFSVETLRDQARQLGLECSLSTVYRNLAAFVEAHLVDELPGEGNRLYTWHTEHEATTHVFCLDCRRLTALAGFDGIGGAPATGLAEALSRSGFDADTVRMMLAVHCKTQTCTVDSA